jgi:hypothetical protein
MVEYTTIGQAAPETEVANEELAKNSSVHAEDDDTEVDDDAEVDKNNLDANHDDDALLCFCIINDILRMTGFALRALVAEELHVVRSNEPASFADVERNPS